MKAIIHYNGYNEYIGNYEDSLAIEAETIDELRDIAFAESNKRNWDVNFCWSEVFDE